MRRSRHDREILGLALPALGALAAEPLYLLVDTAIVGHLGTAQLAALALAATILSSVVSLSIFLTYGTTARVTRLHGAGQEEGAAAGTVAAQLGMGAAFAAVLLRARAPSRRPRWALIRPLIAIGAQIFVRTFSLLACFVVASGVLARTGSEALAAHQIAFQLFI